MHQTCGNVLEKGCERHLMKNVGRRKGGEIKAKKVVAKAMKEAAEQKLRELSEHPNNVFKLGKSMKKDGMVVEGGRCMRGSDGRLNFSKKDRGRVWKEHMERIMNDSRQSSIRNSELCTGLFFFTCQVRVLDTTIYNNNNLHSQCKFCLQPAFHQYY